jgi:hypothetical protein
MDEGAGSCPAGRHPRNGMVLAKTMALVARTNKERRESGALLSKGNRSSMAVASWRIK